MTETIPSFALNVVTLGVSDFTRSVRFYEALGLARRVRATGGEIAFFDAGGIVHALFRWHMLAEMPRYPIRGGLWPFAGITLARMCRSDAQVDAVLAHALALARSCSSRRTVPPSGAIPGIWPIPMAIHGRSCALLDLHLPMTTLRRFFPRPSHAGTGDG
jgi:catechol 2,3-dioxygenase-like lactoylglutathione lyase family enzyme